MEENNIVFDENIANLDLIDVEEQEEEVIVWECDATTGEFIIRGNVD